MWNPLKFAGGPKLRNRSQPLVGWSSPYCGDMWRKYCCLISFFLIVNTCSSCEDTVRQSCVMVSRRWFFGRPFVQWFALSYQTTIVCPVLSDCDAGVLWPNGWTDQDETWHVGRLWPWPHCVRWGPVPHALNGRSHHPIFGPYLLWPNGWMDQDAIWYGGRPQPSHCTSV